MSSVEFGYYPARYEFTGPAFSIGTLPELADAIDRVEHDDFLDNDWIVVPREHRVFGLPKTHQVNVPGDSDDGRAVFLVDCFGFLVGMRMTTTEAGFVDGTPVKRGKLCDIVVGGDPLGEALQYASSFWDAFSARPRVAKAMRGIMHSLMLSQDRHLLGYERFLYLYAALDGCYYVYRQRPGAQVAPTHGARLSLLCSEPATVEPDWLQAVVEARNDTIHEGLFFGEPLGFSIFRQDGSVPRSVPLQMSALISRFVVALLGIPASDYIASPVNTRMRHKLSF